MIAGYVNSRVKIPRNLLHSVRRNLEIQVPPIEIIHNIRLEPFETRAKTFGFSDASGMIAVTGCMEIDFECKHAELRVNEGNAIVKLQRNSVVKMQNAGVYMDKSDGHRKVH
jgi:hypothetical protein